MNIAYFSRPHRRQQTSGGNAHIGQFLDGVLAAGHRVWTSQPDDRTDTQTLPAGRLARLARLRDMDVLYFRLEWQPRSQCRFGLPPYRWLLRRPLVAWELNTVPAYGRLLGASAAAVAAAEADLRRLAAGCDVAFAVWPDLADYARRTLGLRHVVTVSNGSDPALFRPDLPPALPRTPDRLRAVWIGSATLGWHDLDTILAAAAVLRRIGGTDRVQVHLIGEGTERFADAGANVTAHGPIAYTALPAWLAAMDVGLALYKPGPARFSPGLKTFDYLSAALPVVAYDQPPFPALAAEAASAFRLIPAGDAEALARTLLALHADRARTAADGRAGRALIESRYNWSATVRTTLAELERLRARPNC